MVPESNWCSDGFGFLGGLEMIFSNLEVDDDGFHFNDIFY
jgi:hypothetical protein